MEKVERLRERGGGGKAISISATFVSVYKSLLSVSSMARTGLNNPVVCLVCSGGLNA